MTLKIRKMENSEIILLSNVKENLSIPELGLLYNFNKREFVNTTTENSNLAVINRPEVSELYDFSKTIIEKIENKIENEDTDKNVWVNIHWNNHNNSSKLEPNNTIKFGFTPLKN